MAEGRLIHRTKICILHQFFKNDNKGYYFYVDLEYIEQLTEVFYVESYPNHALKLFPLFLDTFWRKYFRKQILKFLSEDPCKCTGGAFPGFVPRRENVSVSFMFPQSHRGHWWFLHKHSPLWNRLHVPVSAYFGTRGCLCLCSSSTSNC